MEVVDNLVQDAVMKEHAKRGMGSEIMLGN